MFFDTPNSWRDCYDHFYLLVKVSEEFKIWRLVVNIDRWTSNKNGNRSVLDAFYLICMLLGTYSYYHDLDRGGCVFKKKTPPLLDRVYYSYIFLAD